VCVATDYLSKHFVITTSKMDIVYLFGSSDKDVQDIIFGLNRTTTHSKIDNLRLAIKNLYFTAQQAFNIVKSFSLEVDKYNACIILYDQLYDKQNVSVMLDAMIYISDRNIVKKTLNLIK
jgi:hypothetical protein